MAYARIQAKSDTLATKEDSETVLADREMAYIYPEEIGQGNAKLICGDGVTPAKDLPFVMGDDAADMQVSLIGDTTEEEIKDGMTISEIMGVIKNTFASAGGGFSTSYDVDTKTLRLISKDRYANGEGVKW